MTDHSVAGFVSAVDWRSISSHLRLVYGFLASIPFVKIGARFGCVTENKRKARFGVGGIFKITKLGDKAANDGRHSVVILINTWT
jgi:hypothetical protein